MSFYTLLVRKAIPEWRDYYISYKVFKTLFEPFKTANDLCTKLIDERIATINHYASLDTNEISEEMEALKIFEEKFENLLRADIEKIDYFFEIKLMEFQNEWKDILHNVKVYKEKKFENVYIEQGAQLKYAFLQFYKKVNCLIQFCNLNYDAVKRILAKHKKLTNAYKKVIALPDFKLENLFKDKYLTMNSDELAKLRDEIRNYFLDIFFHKYNKQKGLQELRKELKTRIISIWHSYFLFFYLGCSIILFLLILILIWNGCLNPEDNETFKYMFPMFRGAAFIVMYFWLTGWNVYGWTRYHINYKKILNFKGQCSSPTEIFMRGTFFSSILFITLIWYIVLNENLGKVYDIISPISIPKEFIPLIIWIFLLGYLFFPSKTYLNGSGRVWLFKTFYSIFFLSLFKMDFGPQWVNEQLLSFVPPLQDFAYTLCYYTSRAADYDNYHPDYCFSNSIFVGFLVAIVPVIFRLMQFGRIYYDQGYIGGPIFLGSICVTIVAFLTTFSFLYGRYPDNYAFMGLWIFFAFSLTTLASYVDIFKDWNLMTSSKKHKYLRENLGYPNKKYYYLAMLTELFLRCTWVFSISPGFIAAIMRPEIFTLILGTLEMIRRAVWNAFIVERIFINNLSNYQNLFEYSLPFEKTLEEGENSMSNGKEEKKVECFRSCDDGEVAVRFEEIRKKLLNCDCLKDAENDEQLIEKLKKCLKNSKEIVDSFDDLEKDVKIYNENLQLKLQIQRERMGSGPSRFSKIMSIFEKNNEIHHS